jgi:NDP-sugar pyrophosphorylase family protein
MKKALIMAAGYGTRLEPLTLAVPKPMVPIVNFPTMQHNLELLKKHGFTDITANIHYHPEQIENYFGDGVKFGVNLSYSFEEKLLGTAGGVKLMAETIAKIDETFVVLSSDALTDINLDRLVEFHRRKKALVTVALCRVTDVREFGVVLQDADERITGFQEKPAPEEAHSDLANTGIYVFEPAILKMIPAGPYDFGRQLFPRLVAEGAAIYGYKMVEYWNDVGGLDKYVQSNYDAMTGAVRIGLPGRRHGKSTWIGERGRIAASARFEGSVIIGDHCTVGQDVYIKDAVIGDKCTIENGAVIVGSVLWSNVTVGARAEVRDSIVGGFCYLGARARIEPGSVMANRCTVRAEQQVPAASKIQPDTIV